MSIGATVASCAFLVVGLLVLMALAARAERNAR